MGDELEPSRILTDIEQRLLTDLEQRLTSLDERAAAIEEGRRRDEASFNAWANKVNTTLDTLVFEAAAADQNGATLADIAEVKRKLELNINETTRLSEFTRKLEAFFAPLIRDKNPPLDGEQIATKAFVDNSLQTYARANPPPDIKRLGPALDLAKALLDRLGAALDAEGDAPEASWARVARRLRWIYDREKKRFDAEQQPSRLASLVYAITGRANGAPGGSR